MTECEVVNTVFLVKKVSETILLGTQFQRYMLYSSFFLGVHPVPYRIVFTFYFSL